MHLRSGDIWARPELGRGYGQPPCNFYLDVMKKKNWSDIILLSEDRRNICVDVLVKHGAKYVRRPWHIDVTYLLNAENLAVSRGSIWVAISKLSIKLKNLYMFDQGQTTIRDHMNCVATPQFRDSVLGFWEKSPSQLDLILTSSCERWEFVKSKPQRPEDPFAFEGTI